MVKFMKQIQLLGLLFGFFGFGCGTKEEGRSEKIQDKSATEASISSESFWMHRLVDTNKLAPFVGDSGWQSYYTRDFQDAMRGSSGGALARQHLEHSSLYRQALLMHSNASKNVYTQYKSEEDPIQSQYVLAVASIFLGEFEEAQKILNTFPADPILDEHVAQWKAWLASDRKATPKLSGFFFSEDGAKKNTPPAWTEQQYFFSLPNDVSYEVSEGTSLWMLAKWHEKQAEDLIKDFEYGSDLIQQWLAPWRLPFERSFVPKASEKVLAVPDEFLLFGFYLQPEDIAFSSSIQNEPLVALKNWSSKSPLAHHLSACVKEKLLNPECLVDSSMQLEEIVRNANKEATKDIPIEELNAELLYETFPSFARYSLLRMGAHFALRNNQSRDSGILQLMVREASGPLRDPVFLTFFSAWEAGNNSTLRAQDLVHELSSEFSPLHSARVPLDFLHIRLGRNAVPSGASH
jgi:hypothetical protein